MKSVKQNKVIPNLIWNLPRLPLSFLNGGFTLIEILVVILIIGILGAIAVPQYQRAVLKSRYASLMPIAKAMADSNEAYFLEHGVYADNAQDLPVQGRQNYPDGTTLEFGTTSDYAYILATRDNDFPNNYIVYQKHSGEFPGEIHCEAAANDTQAQEVCKSFGATEDIGETLTSGYLTYVLFGTGNGIAPTEPQGPVCPDGATCDDGGNITACPNGQTLNSGSCEDCATAFPNATACSTTEYQPTQCGTGYVVSNGVCEPEPEEPRPTVTKVECVSVWCKYSYEGIANYLMEWPTRKYTFNCNPDEGNCSEVFQNETSGGGRIQDPLLPQLIQYNADGSLEYVYVALGNQTSIGHISGYFDGNGNYLGGSATAPGGIASSSPGNAGGISTAGTVRYDALGNVRSVQFVGNSQWYYYDAEGNALSDSAPVQDVSGYNILSTEEYTGLQSRANKIKTKTKCQLYPELQECAANTSN